MSGAFDRTWLLVKDFYFAPAQWGTLGLFVPDDYDEEGNVISTNPYGEPTFYRDRDFLEWHKNEGGHDLANEPIPFYAETPNEPFRRGGSMIPAGNRPTGTVGINLSNVAHYRDSEQSMIDEILTTLMHEDAHAAAWHEIENEMEGVEPTDEVRNPMNRAQEMAAFQLEYPGGADADRAARERYAGYLPEWQTPYGMPRGVIR